MTSKAHTRVADDAGVMCSGSVTGTWGLLGSCNAAEFAKDLSASDRKAQSL